MPHAAFAFESHVATGTGGYLLLSADGLEGKDHTVKEGIDKEGYRRMEQRRADIAEGRSRKLLDGTWDQGLGASSATCERMVDGICSSKLDPVAAAAAAAAAAWFRFPAVCGS